MLRRRNGILIDGRNILRPETVESLYIAYRLTGDSIYRAWGWRIFRAFEQHCRVSEGFVGVEDVQSVPVKHLDKMETFWLGETLSTPEVPLECAELICRISVSAV